MLTLRSFLLAIGAFLFVCASAAAQRQRLSVPVTAQGDVRRFDVTPDGRSAVYSVRQDAGAPFRLYSIGLPDGDTKLLDPDSSEVFFITDDGRRVVYARIAEVRSVPIDGSEAPTVSLMNGPGLYFSPDGRWAVCRADPGLWVAPVDGSAAPALIHADPRIHWTIAFTPDSSHVLYVTEGSINFNSGSGHLYSARLDRSTPPVALNDITSEATCGSFFSSPDGKRVLFRNGRVETVSKRLFTAPIDGGAPAVRLNPTLPAGSFDIFTIYTVPRFTPDSAWIVYQVDQEASGRTEVYTVPAAGGAAPIKLNGPLVAGGEVLTRRLTPDGKRVIYQATQDSADAFELWAVPLFGGPQRKLSRPGEEAYSFDASPDSRQVAYVADVGADGHQLFLTALEPGSAVVQLSDAGETPFVWGLPERGAFTADGQWISYSSRVLEDGEFHLHVNAVRTKGTPRPARLDSPAVPGSTVHGRTLSESPMRYAAGPLMVYIADLERRGVFELWASPLPKRTTTRR